MPSGAFDLLDRPLLFVPVRWAGLGSTDDGGAKVIEHVVEVQIELLDRDEFAEWIVEGGKTPEEKVERAAHDLATFKRVAKGWRKIKASGRDVPFTDENIASLLRWPGFMSAFGATYMDAWRGELATREGNSEGSPANGPAVEPTDETPKVATSSPAKS